MNITLVTERISIPFLLLSGIKQIDYILSTPPAGKAVVVIFFPRINMHLNLLSNIPVRFISFFISEIHEIECSHFIVHSTSILIFSLCHSSITRVTETFWVYIFSI